MFNNNIVVVTILPLIVHFLMWSEPVQCIYIHKVASQCPDSLCFTLSLLTEISNNSHLTVTDKTMIFEPGEHSLDSELRISNAISFSMIADTSSSSNNNVTIVCNRDGGFKFIGGHNIHVKGLSFVGCSGNKLEYVDQFTIEDTNFVGRKRNPIHPYMRTRGSILNVFRSTSVTFVRTSFKENQFGKGQRTVFLDYDPQYDSYRVVAHNLEVGGAILAEESKLEIVECLFENNKAGFGGALFASNNSTITIIKSSFLGNVANFFYPGIQDAIHSTGDWLTEFGTGGGAIYADQTSLFIANSSFIGNTAQNGGAVRFITNNGTVTITESEFTDNTALDGGGAMWWTSTDSKISITNNSFVGNTAVIGDSGGVLKLAKMFSTITTVSGNMFSNNSARNKSGGVISICNSHPSANTIISYNQFINNHANQSGGVLSFLNNEYYVHESPDVILNDNLFRNNSALAEGGIFELRNANIRVTRSKFIGNGVNNSGGVFSVVGSNLAISQSVFQSNTAGKDGGVIMADSSDISISDSGFIDNKGGHGGVIKARQTYLSILNVSLVRNRADFGGVLSVELMEVEFYDVLVVDNLAYTDGGVFHTYITHIAIRGADFLGNRADNNGGIMLSVRDRISMVDCRFNLSTAGNDGGVIRSYLSDVNVSSSTFIGNEAKVQGGVYHVEQSTLKISNHSLFKDNTADTGGVIWNYAGASDIYDASFIHNVANTAGVIWIDAGTAAINEANFTSNIANTGAVMWLDQAAITGAIVSVTDNHANYTIIYSMESTIEFTDSILSSNFGSLCAIESSIVLMDVAMINMQTVSQSNANHLAEGGAITAFQSEITFDGIISLMHNRAPTGGSVIATEAKLRIHGTVIVTNNTASQSGGGIYLYQSEIICQKTSALKLSGNTALEKGGGIYAVGSLIKVKVPKLLIQKHSMLNFVSNKADKGGGIFLEMDSKVYILKSIANNFTEKHEMIKFTTNEANYGGAVYVSDDGMCSLSSSNKECFFQALALYGNAPLTNLDSNANIMCKNIYFEENRARITGSSLYGGLLDRCRISPLAELPLSNASKGLTLSNRTITVGGLEYFRSISNIQASDISSPAVRVCFCRDGQPDCSYHPAPVPIRRDQLTEIPLSLAALDQINRPIEATIYNRLSSGDDLCQHHIQTYDGNCSVINFTASLNLNESQKEDLILLTGGPCKEVPNSQLRLTFNVYCPKCPVGFDLLSDEEGCRCECAEILLPFISNCRLSSNAIVRDKNIWIAYINTTDNYLIHPFCPLDYCQPSSSLVEVNLNLPNGSDSQCANGRSGLLCGTCQPGLSLSIGSSHCIPCPSHWPANLAAIIIAALLAGIILVVFILLLNLTVAMGTFNAIIFYANVLAIKNSTFQRFSSPNIATVLVSWLNLEVGFDACFFEGMDAFSKSLLQLAFPTYIISVVIAIIIISEYSSKFSNIIGKRNPVATLATLILLSYTTLLNSVITSLSYAVLKYPDGSQRTVWLADASVDYLTGKHVGLFIIATIILIVGALYTVLLLSWQWLLRHQNFRLLKWINSPKMYHFIEPYHAPYTFKHRYWTGLLLLSRVLLHLVSAVNTTGDPRVNILATALIIGCLLLIKGMVATKVYRSKLVDLTETIVYFNLLALAALTWYTLDAGKSQASVAYISVLIVFALLMAVITAHVYWYTSLFTMFKSTWIFKQALVKIQVIKKQAKDVNESKSSTLEPQSKSIKGYQENSEPTFTVVEMVHMRDHQVCSGIYTVTSDADNNH